jgi:hypothetical protein
MKKILFITVLVAASLGAVGQVTDGEKQLKTQTVDTLLGWKRGGVININTSQTSMTNWAAGGQSSMSVNGLLSLYAHKKAAKTLWENFLDLGYGTMKQKEQDWWKTDDRIDFTSKYGIEITEKLYYAALLNFKTQMTNGYNYPNDSDKISGFLAPGYLMGALGIDYKPNANIAVFLAPATLKLTMVNDDALSDAGSFGVDPGDNLKTEFGGYMRTTITYALMENVGIQSKLDLFTNYLKDFGCIDVSWETLLSLKVNKFISATVSTHLLYDQDVIITKENDEGEMESYNSKVQFKEVLAIGFSMKY